MIPVGSWQEKLVRKLLQQPPSPHFTSTTRGHFAIVAVPNFRSLAKKLVNMVPYRFHTAVLMAGALFLCASLSGCQSNPWGQWNEMIKGNGFTSWNESMSTGVRGKDPNAKPSGFFTDRKSEQIEQNLGGGF